MPLLDGSRRSWRKDFLIEHAGARVPPYCGVHTSRWVYVKYGTGEEELYDLRTDPYELQNEANRPTFAPLLALMRSRLASLCDPPPPGVTP